jgi:hypothetical protein
MPEENPLFLGEYGSVRKRQNDKNVGNCRPLSHFMLIEQRDSVMRQYCLIYKIVAGRKGFCLTAPLLGHAPNYSLQMARFVRTFVT